MASQTDRRGVAVYAAVVMAGSMAISALLYAMNLAVDDSRSVVFILAAMWMPALGRMVATRTVDRGWRSPFPLRRWGRPRAAVVLVPLATVSAIYVGAYVIAILANLPREAPVWQGTRMALNIAVNLPLLATIGLMGAIGEELGWQGYLQPRLHQLQVPGPLLWGAALGTCFHIPLILLAGYLASESLVASIALAFGLGLGVTSLWTWATFRWRTIWMAVWFHTFHNAVSQVLVPKALGAGDPLVLGESGVLPVALYLATAAAVFGISKARGWPWRALARYALSEALVKDGLGIGG